MIVASSIRFPQVRATGWQDDVREVGLALIREQVPVALRYKNSASAEFRDAAASENKALPVHRWVPWIAGYSGPFVQDAIAAYLPSRGRDSQVVLDPFAGVGTTLVEALMSGRNAVGYELNAFAALAARAKVACVDVSPASFESAIDSFRAAMVRFERTIDRRWSEGGEAALRSNLKKLSRLRPERFRSRIPLFSPPVEAKFLFAVGQTSSVPADLRALFQVALGATMISFSNYTYEPSLSSRPGAGKALIENASVALPVCGKLDVMLDDVTSVIEQYGAVWSPRRREVVGASYFGSTLPPRSVSLLVTSPPYMNNYHYVRNTRPQLHWLGLIEDQDQLRGYEDASFGKFWQTVRQRRSVELECDLPSLAANIEQLRALHLERGPYGGSGWANYVATYFNDCERFLHIARRQLKAGGRAVIVVGNSIIQGIEFRVDELLAELAERLGFTIENIHIVRNKRVGNSIIDSSVRNGTGNGHRQKTQLYDAAVILRH